MQYETTLLIISLTQQHRNSFGKMSYSIQTLTMLTYTHLTCVPLTLFNSSPSV
jgi:hypothetical protein